MAINSRIGIDTNLPVGATNDLLLITYEDSFPEGKILFDIDVTPRKVTGIQKVAQLFLKILLTDRGSDLLRPSEGTVFSNYVINSNRTGVDSQLYALISREITAAGNQVKYILNDDDNEDLSSQLFSVEAKGIDVQKESVTIFVQIITRAGEQAQVAIPFPQFDMPLSDA